MISGNIYCVNRKTGASGPGATMLELAEKRKAVLYVVPRSTSRSAFPKASILWGPSP